MENWYLNNNESEYDLFSYLIFLILCFHDTGPVHFYMNV